MRPEDVRRLYSRIAVGLEDDCWEFVSKSERPTARYSYGMIYVEGRQQPAHRLVLEAKLGRKLLPGMVAMHLCDNVRCCNPKHLEEGTPRENARQRVERGRHVPGRDGGRSQPVDRLWQKIALAGEDDCWNWTGAAWSNFGYGHLTVFGKRTAAHRLMLEISLMRPLSAGECALHTGDNPRCCNPAHLHAGSRAENLAEAAARQRVASGVRSGTAKLTAEQVGEIRRRYAEESLRQEDLAAEYGVCRRTVGRALAGVDRKYDPGERREPGRGQQGERNRTAKLTAAQVREMRELYAMGRHSLQALGRRFGVHPGTAKAAVAGETWAEAGGPVHMGLPHDLRQRPCGEAAGAAKLTNAQARRLRERYAAGGVRMAELAAQYGLARKSVALLLKGETYPAAGGPLLREDGRAFRHRWYRGPRARRKGLGRRMAVRAREPGAGIGTEMGTADRDRGGEKRGPEGPPRGDFVPGEK